MKKQVLCFLLAALSLSFFGCGSKTELAIGEAAVTDRAEMALTNFTLTETISTEKNTDEFLLPATKEDIAAYDGKTKTAAEGTVFACISYTYRNTGKNAIQTAARELPEGGCISQGAYIGAFLDIIYDDDCTYSGYGHCRDSFRVSEGFRTGAEGGLCPSPAEWATASLNAVQTDRCYFELPAEVMERKDAPLRVVFYVPSAEGTTPFSYSVR